MNDRVVIYLGPSLPVEQARAILPDADYRPPIRRGDLEPLLDQPPAILGIIDGQFHRRLAISPREIMPLLDGRTQVLGASSMGALRAVELAHRGMIGVGTIFRWFRDGRLSAEDEVALVFHGDTGRSLSEPLVNIRHALSIAVKQGIIDRRARNRLIAVARQLYFPERSYRRMLVEARQTLDPAVLARLSTWLDQAPPPDLKAEDAARLLRRARALHRSRRRAPAIS